MRYKLKKNRILLCVSMCVVLIFSSVSFTSAESFRTNEAPKKYILSAIKESTSLEEENKRSVFFASAYCGFISWFGFSCEQESEIQTDMQPLTPLNPEGVETGKEEQENVGSITENELEELRYEISLLKKKIANYQPGSLAVGQPSTYGSTDNLEDIERLLENIAIVQSSLENSVEKNLQYKGVMSEDLLALEKKLLSKIPQSTSGQTVVSVPDYRGEAALAGIRSLTGVRQSVTDTNITPYAGNLYAGSLILSGAGTSTFGGSVLSTLHGVFGGNLTAGGGLSVDSGTLYVDAVNNRVGVGTTTPQEMLSVAGAVGIDESIYLKDHTPSSGVSRLYNLGGDLYWNGAPIVASSTGNWTGLGGNVYRLTGNVGIGTSTPTSQLTVVGDGLFTGGLSMGATSSFAAPLIVTPTRDMGGWNAGEGALSIVNNANVGSALAIYTNALHTSSNGPLAIMESTNASASGGLLRLNKATSNGAAYNLRLDGPAVDIEFIETDQAGAAGQFEIAVNSDALQINGRAADDSQFVPIALFSRQEDGGTVGIGTGYDEADARLEIISTTTRPALQVSSDTASSGDMFVVRENGRVGIGYSGPAHDLHVRGSSGSVLGLERTGVTNPNEWRFRITSDAGNSIGASSLILEPNDVEGDFALRDIADVPSFIVDNSENNVYVPNGRLAIGQAAASNKLHVHVSDGDGVHGIEVEQDDLTNDRIGIQINQTSNGKALEINNAGTGNGLRINQTGTTSNSTSVGGALNINNTDNSGAGLIVYSNMGSAADGRLLSVRADNSAFDQDVFVLTNDGQSTTFYLDANNSGRAIYVDHDDTGINPSVDINRSGNNTAGIAGLRVNVANSGAGDAYAALFESGNVGIGTSTPASMLTVAGSGMFSGGLVLTEDLSLLGGSTDILHDGELDLYPDGQTTIGLRIDQDGANLDLSALGSSRIDINDGLYVSGNVSFGTSTSTQRFNISGDIGLGNGDRIGLQDDSAYLSFDPSNSGMINTYGSFYDIYNSYYRVRNATLEAWNGINMRDDDFAMIGDSTNAGNTANSAGRFIQRSRYWDGDSSNDHNFRIQHIQDENGTTSQPTSRVAFSFENTDDYLENEALTILSTGSVGVGDTSADFGLEVGVRSNTGYFGVSSSTDGDLFVVDENGNVGIGTANPDSSYKLHVYGGHTLLQETTQSLGAVLQVQDVGGAGDGRVVAIRSYRDGAEALKIDYPTGKGARGITISGGTGEGIEIDKDSADALALDVTYNPTNMNYTTGGISLDMNAEVTDAGTYAYSGTGLNIVSHVTETSGTITDSSILMNLDQQHGDATGNVLMLTNSGSGNSLVIDQNGGVGTTVATDGALHIENTGNTGIGFGLYSNLDVTADAPLMIAHADNTGFDQNVFDIINDGIKIGLNIDQNSNHSAIVIDQDDSGNAPSLDIDRDGANNGDFAGLRINVSNSMAGNAYAALFETGNVGIGTSTPQHALEVIGEIGLEMTNSTTTGVITKGGVPFIHTFQHPTGGTAIPEGKNTFIGMNAGNFNIGADATLDYHGSNNTAVGFKSMASTTRGFSNTAVGSFSLYSNGYGNSNVAIGREALYSNTTGNTNTAVGRSALHYNTTGGYNVALGRDALLNNTFAGFNTAIGTYALYNISTTTSEYNTALGYQAGRYIANGSTANQTSSSSVYVGANTKALVDGGYNENVFGYDAVGIGDNSVVLGNDNIATTALKGYVGIGTTTPSAQLTTTGTIQFTSLGSGTLTSDASGNITVSSDARLKNVIGNVETGLEELLSLEGKRWHWNEESGMDKNSVYQGFIAQDVEVLIPDAVGEAKTGYKTLSYHALLPTVVNAIQELNIKVQQAALSGGYQSDGGALSEYVSGRHVFGGEIVFRGGTVFNGDTAGQVVIRSGNTSAQVLFENQYPNPPIVTVTPVGLQNVLYGVDYVGTTDFTIMIDKEVDHDIVFNWHALGVEADSVFVPEPASVVQEEIQEPEEQQPSQEEPQGGENVGGEEEGNEENTGEEEQTSGAESDFEEETGDEQNEETQQEQGEEEDMTNETSEGVGSKE